MSNEVNNINLHIDINSGNIINKYYVENGIVLERENFDLYFNEITEESSFILNMKEKYLSKINLELFSDKDFNRSNDTELLKALEFYKINFIRNKITSLVLIRKDAFYSLNQNKNVDPKDIKDLICFVKSKLNLILNSNEPEKIIYKKRELPDFKQNELICLSEDKEEFLISNIVLFSIIKLIYKIDNTDIKEND